MRHVDEPRLESDLAYRFQYLAEFVGFGEQDVAAIHAAAPHLAPVVPDLVNASTTSSTLTTRRGGTSSRGSPATRARCR